MADDDSNNTGGGRTLEGGPAEPMPESWARPTQAPRLGRVGNWSGTSGGNSSRSGSRFASLGSLNAQSGGGGGARSAPSGHAGHGHGDDSDDDDDDESKRESWFAGGERSGLSIQNPDHRSRTPGGSVVRDLLRRAAEGGPARDPGPQSTAFRGGGHTLGSDEVESSYVSDPDAVGPNDEVPVVRNLTFWSNGFSLEGGPLMRYDNPEHAQLLAQLQSNQAPPEFLNLRVGQPVDIRIAERLNEEYVPPSTSGAFSGSGNRLGAPVPDFSDAGSSSRSTSMPGQFPTSAAEATVDRESLTTRFEVDQTLPTTSVQIRLADGTRIVCRMNLTHKVRDLRNFINAARNENATRAYTIGTTFPNRVLDDLDATIEGAGLANSVVVQRWA